jgi:hypothetical protein
VGTGGDLRGSPGEELSEFNPVEFFLRLRGAFPATLYRRAALLMLKL